MVDVLTNGLAPFLAAVAVLIGWHFRRRSLGLPRRKEDYYWAFVHGGILYALATLIVLHYALHRPYADLMAGGFADVQLNIALFAALFESVWGLWNLWDGLGISAAEEGV